MPVNVCWLLEYKIIQVSVTGDISLDDIRFLSESIVTHFEQSDAPLIHVLVTKEGSGMLPKTLKSVVEATKFLTHNQLGWFIIYGNMKHQTIAVFFSSVITGITKVRHRRYDTLEASLKFLTSIDSNLPPLDALLEGNG